MKSKIIRVLLICIIPLAVYGIAAGEMDGDKIRHAIDASALAREQKDSLLSISNDAVKAGIPAADIVLIVSRGLDREWGRKSLEETFSLLIMTQKQGLPLSPVLDRFHQGASKGVPFEKVFFSATRLTEKLSTADGMVGNLMRGGLREEKGGEKAGAVGTVARALEKSIPEGEITSIGLKLVKNKHSLSRFDAVVSAMTTFTEMGVPNEQAARSMNKIVDKGYSEKEMMKMERDVTRGMKEGRKFEDLMRHMESMMRGSGMPGMGSGSGMHGGSGSHGGSGMSGQGMGGGSGAGMEGGGMGGGSGAGMEDGGMGGHKGGKHGM